MKHLAACVLVLALTLSLGGQVLADTQMTVNVAAGGSV